MIPRITNSLYINSSLSACANSSGNVLTYVHAICTVHVAEKPVRIRRRLQSYAKRIVKTIIATQHIIGIGRISCKVCASVPLSMYDVHVNGVHAFIRVCTSTCTVITLELIIWNMQNKVTSFIYTVGGRRTCLVFFLCWGNHLQSIHMYG